MGIAFVTLAALTDVNYVSTINTLKTNHRIVKTQLDVNNCWNFTTTP